MNLNLQVGPQQAGLGAIVAARGGKGAEVSVSELRARYYQTTYDGAGFSVSAQAVLTTSVGLVTTYTGLALVNPINSPVNLILNKCSWMQSVIQSVQPEAVSLAFGFNNVTAVTLTTPATPQSNKIGSGIAAQAKAATSAILPTAPLYSTFVGNTSSATTNGTGGVIDLEGSIILTPGAYAIWATPGQASVAGMWFSYSWEEQPI
jgi:hypothetical protein